MPPEALAKTQQIARHNQAVALCRTGELAKAEETYQALAAENPAAIQYRFNLAAVRQARGHTAEALSTWKGVTADTETLPRDDAAFAWWAQGQMQMELGQSEEAVESYARVTSLTPSDAQAWQALAVAARCSGSLGRALVAEEAEPERVHHLALVVADR